ncbi:unnamed protein product [Ostreobium quekettii]|uniref:Glycerol-3-phosphate dehydrogenase NAD-dependent N-terminal domain-containing protein n=1 Tax=Ostreobium quekettii TaxID=121088 RepID=A0A8S1J1K2_9CHLO|nr:unnamed protein product [Ostreobium quekettii]
MRKGKKTNNTLHSVQNCSWAFGRLQQTGVPQGVHCARMGHDTLLWALEKEVVESINGPLKENTTFLKGVKIPPGLVATNDLPQVVAHGEIVLMVVPTPFVATTLAPVAKLFRKDQILVSCTKGILNQTLQTVDEILQDVLPSGKVAFLSGPSFAAEVVRETPTAVTIAAMACSWRRRFFPDIVVSLAVGIPLDRNLPYRIAKTGAKPT